MPYTKESHKKIKKFDFKSNSHRNDLTARFVEITFFKLLFHTQTLSVGSGKQLADKVVKLISEGAKFSIRSKKC